MSPKSAEGRLKEVLCFQLKFVKNALQIGRRPIERSFMFYFEICEKMSPKSAEGRFKKVLCFYLKFVKNALQIGRRPIKESFMF